MTTAATVVGHFPLVLATGPGAGARNSIGIMLVSGMIVGTLFTLFIVPSIYVLVARNRVAVPAVAGAALSPAHAAPFHPLPVEQSLGHERPNA
jgi:multidrug efflux pump